MKLNRSVLRYILTKLSALGLLILIMCSYLVLVNGFDMFGFTESLSNLSFWGLIGGSALITTMMIDLVRVKWIRLRFSLKQQ